MNNIKIPSGDLNRYPALEELRTKLTPTLQEAMNKNGVEIDQDIPGDGVLVIHFGNLPDGHHGWSHTLRIDQGGAILSLREQGVSPPSSRPTFSLSPEGTKSLIDDLFSKLGIGKYALRNTIVSVKSAREYWDAKLAKYDVCNAKGFYTDRVAKKAGDGRIDHVDILTYVAKEKQKGREITPEQVEREILEIIQPKK